MKTAKELFQAILAGEILENTTIGARVFLDHTTGALCIVNPTRSRIDLLSLEDWGVLVPKTHTLVYVDLQKYNQTIEVTSENGAVRALLRQEGNLLLGSWLAFPAHWLSAGILAQTTHCQILAADPVTHPRPEFEVAGIGRFTTWYAPTYTSSPYWPVSSYLCPTQMEAEQRYDELYSALHILTHKADKELTVDDTRPLTRRWR